MTDPTERQLRELFAADAAGAPDPGGLAALTLHKVRHRRRVRTTAATGLIAAVVVADGVTAVGRSAGSGSGAPPASTADCSFAVRFGGTMFVSEAQAPLPSDPVEQLGEAEVESCDDTGPPLPGATPRGEPERVTVSAHPGYDPRQVLTVPDPVDGVRVLVSADLPRELRLQIIAALHAPEAS